MPRLTLYTKRDCPLCDEALALVQRLAPEFGLAVEAVDIEGEPSLRQRYQYLVPVVGVDGEALLYPPIAEPALREALTRRLGVRGGSRSGV